MAHRIRVQGYQVGFRPIQLIYIVRAATGIGLREAKELADCLLAGETIEWTQPDAVPEKVCEQLLRDALVANVELISDDGQPPKVIEIPFPPPVLICPACQRRLTHRTECSHCDWLAFPSDRKLWSTAGNCDRCGFSYRWDGRRCSNCGYGSGRT